MPAHIPGHRLGRVIAAVVKEPGREIHTDIYGMYPSSREDDDYYITRHLGAIARRCLRQIEKNGALTVYREIGISDFDAWFAAAKARPTELGAFWSFSRYAACMDHFSDNAGTPYLLRASVKPNAIDWLESFRANLANPGECEIFVTGRIKLLSIWDPVRLRSHFPTRQHFSA